MVQALAQHLGVCAADDKGRRLDRFYQRPAEASVQVYQLSYDDKAGRFPWEVGYAAPDRQPRPGTFRA